MSLDHDSLKRQTMDISAAEHWEAAATGRNEEAYGNPHSMNAVRLRMTLDILKQYPAGTMLDAGCGAGATTKAFVDAGWDVEAVDNAINMVAETNAHLESTGYAGCRARQASITDLGLFPDNHFDAVTCLGVLYYIEQDELAYREFRRILKPGGILICSVQNEFFDLFTFNRYTHRFFTRHFFPLIDGGTAERTEELHAALRSLMTHPDAPAKHDSGSARDAVFTRQENPLAFPAKLAEFGFATISGPYYHGIHLLPPLIEKILPGLEQESHQKQYRLAKDWRSMFTAAHFLLEARKNDDAS